MGREVWLTSSASADKICDSLPSNIGRQSLVLSLIRAYSLDVQCAGIIPIFEARARDLCMFHTSEFVDQLFKKNASDEDCSKFGLVDDCYVFDGMAEYVKVVAGSSIAASKKLIERADHNPICVNWYGGRHHCSKSKASGFCYVNDIVLAINILRGKFKKVFYLDLDLHHGDGVENAFRYSNKVITCSIHRHDVGFFPGTGENCIGQGVVNIPTKRGLSDETLMVLINDIVIEVLQKEAPEALVIQCGTDGLTTDKHKEWNLSIKGMAAAIDTVMASCPVPTLLLGGGGYNHVETAKCWTYVTNKVLGNDNLAGEIPDHQFMDEYEQSGYQFWYDSNTIPSKMKDMNSAEYVQKLKSAIGTGKKI